MRNAYKNNRKRYTGLNIEKQKTRPKPGFLIDNLNKIRLLSSTYSSVASTASSSASTTGRPTSSTNAIGALSPARKPHFKIRV